MSNDTGYAWDLFPTEEQPLMRPPRQRWLVALFILLIAAVAAAAVVGSRLSTTTTTSVPTTPETALPCAIAAEVTTGSTGPDAACVEAALRNSGYTVVIDAAISPAEGDEIIRFQSEHGRSTDGVVGKRTAESLGVTWAG